jgi:hypothetical protein
VGNLGVFQKLKKVYEPVKFVSTATKVVNIRVIEHPVKRYVAAIVDGQTPRLDDLVGLVFDVVVGIHHLIVLDVA